MVCVPCRDGSHRDCPELARQRRPDLNRTEKLSSQLCACQHAGAELRPGSMLAPVSFDDAGMSVPDGTVLA